MATKQAPKKAAPKATPKAKASAKKAPAKKPIAKAKPVDESKPSKAPVKKSQSPAEVEVIREEVKAVKAVSMSSDIDAMSSVAMLPATQKIQAHVITEPGEKGNFVVDVIKAPSARVQSGPAPDRVKFADTLARKGVAPRPKDVTFGWKTR